MTDRQEQFERAQRAERLRQVQESSGHGGYRKLARHFGWNENTIKGHLQGKSSFGIVTGKRYAKAFKVSFEWLYFGKGEPTDLDEAEPVSAIDVPLIPMISAGQLTTHDGVTSFEDFPTISALDLPEGDWIALRVEGDSMNKISPPGSIIFVNRKDRRLVQNGCYVVSDELGNSTYKRYRQNDDPPFQPASYHSVDAPELDGAISIVGRVRRSVIEM